MSEMTALERGYRRVLTCYPRSFGKGEDWARPLSAACFGLLTLSVLYALSQHAATYVPASMIAAAVVWAIGLASVVLICTPAACRYYRPPLVQP